MNERLLRSDISGKQSNNAGSYGLNQLVTGAVSGFSMLCLTTVFHPVSGAHFNPVLSLASALINRVTPVRALVYILCHCGAALSGALLVFHLFGGFHYTLPQVTLSDFILQMFLSVLLTLTFLKVTDEENPRR